MNKKKIWGIAGIILLICLLAVPVQASTTGSAKKAYNKFLSQSKIKWVDKYVSTKELEFCLVDINGDKVPELYVGYPNAFGYQGCYALYAYVSGKVKEVYHFGNGQALGDYYPSKGVFVDGGGRMGSMLGYYVKYSASGKTSTKIFEVANMVMQPNGTIKTVKQYYSGKSFDTGKKISKNSFTEKKKALLGKASKKKPGSMKKNTSANRGKYLK